MTLDVKHARSTLAGLRQLAEGIEALYAGQPLAPNVNSPGDVERNNFSNPNLVFHAHACGVLSVESVHDHLIAFLRAFDEPATVLAPWTCARGALESSAIAAWLLDPSIDARTRIGRHFAWRYEGFEQQKKMLEEARDSVNLKKLETRVDKVEADALSIGFTKLAKNGSRTGIGTRWPGITQLIADVSVRSGKSSYRLLSSIAHGHHWALHQVGYNVDRTPSGLLAAKEVKPESVAWTCMLLFEAIALPVSFLWQLYGLDWKALTILLETCADECGFNANIRFWQSAVASP